MNAQQKLMGLVMKSNMDASRIIEDDEIEKSNKELERLDYELTEEGKQFINIIENLTGRYCSGNFSVRHAAFCKMRNIFIKNEVKNG